MSNSRRDSQCEPFLGIVEHDPVILQYVSSLVAVKKRIVDINKLVENYNGQDYSIQIEHCCANLRKICEILLQAIEIFNKTEIFVSNKNRNIKINKLTFRERLQNLSFINEYSYPQSFASFHENSEGFILSTSDQRPDYLQGRMKHFKLGGVRYIKDPSLNVNADQILTIYKLCSNILHDTSTRVQIDRIIKNIGIENENITQWLRYHTVEIILYRPDKWFTTVFFNMRLESRDQPTAEVVYSFCPRNDG